MGWAVHFLVIRYFLHTAPLCTVCVCVCVVFSAEWLGHPQAHFGVSFGLLWSTSLIAPTSLIGPAPLLASSFPLVNSSIGALLLPAEGIAPLLQNHDRGVRFPATLCPSSRGRITFVESDGINKSFCTPHLVPFVGKYSKWPLNGVFFCLL